jgi:hypothetical protein
MLPRTLDNAGDAVSSAFPKGKKHDKLNGSPWNSPLAISKNSWQLNQKLFYYCFLEHLVMFFMQV